MPQTHREVENAAIADERAECLQQLAQARQEIDNRSRRVQLENDEMPQPRGRWPENRPFAADRLLDRQGENGGWMKRRAVLFWGVTALVVPMVVAQTATPRITSPLADARIEIWKTRRKLRLYSGDRQAILAW
jgi:hypothetical protein